MTPCRPAYLFSLQAEATRSSVEHRACRLFDKGLGHLISTLDGSAQDHIKVAEFLEVENSARYQPDSQTYCNVYAVDFCQILGAYLPRVWWKTDEFIETHEISSNGLVRWLNKFGHHFGWRRVLDVTAASRCAASGQATVAIAASTRSGAHGHIAMLIYDDVKGTTHLSHAGEQNAKYGPAITSWSSGKYSETYFWTNINERTNLNIEYGSLILPKLLGISEAALDIALFLATARDQLLPVGDDFIRALAYAEDRRFLDHSGYDIVGIARAIVGMITARKIQGASTIEQQLVRTITNRRELSLLRKLTEIVLARFVCRNYSKTYVATTYLNIGYFGYGMNGLDQAAKKLKVKFPNASRGEIALLVASLRYPLARTPGGTRSELRLKRARWIEAGMGEANAACK